MNDATSAALAFAALFLGLAAYLAYLGRVARRLARRLDTIETTKTGK